MVRVQKVDALLVEVRQQRRKNVARPGVFDASDGLTRYGSRRMRFRGLAAACTIGSADSEITND